MHISKSELKQFKEEAFNRYAFDMGVELGVNGKGGYEIRKGAARYYPKSAKKAKEIFERLTTL